MKITKIPLVYIPIYSQTKAIDAIPKIHSKMNLNAIQDSIKIVQNRIEIHKGRRAEVLTCIEGCEDLVECTIEIEKEDGVILKQLQSLKKKHIAAQQKGK